jgi:DNA-directed RNA polymerase sigma subunit (sigma70/sigma32)
MAGSRMDEIIFEQYERAKVQQWLGDRQDAGIRDVLNTLSYNPRLVIELRYGLADGHRYSIEETATVVAKPSSWVTCIESYALFQLYEFLEPAGRLPETARD